jgi:chromosome segregation ATPase
VKTDRSDPSDPLPPEQSEWHEVEAQIKQLEQALQDLKQRLANVRSMQNDRDRLKQQQQELRSQLQDASSQGNGSIVQQLKQDLAQISSQLDLLEVDLESRLISWSSFREPFWQIIRFGGLGVLIGVAIKSCTG